MRVLGIDPGSRVLGFGVVEQQGTSLRAIDHGTIAPGGSLPLEQRLALIFTGLTVVLEESRPDAVAIEGLFSHKNARSALVLGHARGVALLCAARAGLQVFEYAPSEVKKAVGASGNAEKEQVIKLLRGFLGIESFERHDAADALALAICHLNRHRFNARLASGIVRR